MKKRVIAFLSSVLVFLLTCWTAKFSVITVGWAESVSFFAFTFLFLKENAKNDKEFFSIILAILIGRICLEVPIRILDFHGTLYSLYILLLCVLSIVLAAVCVRNNKTIVFVLSTIIGVLMNSIGHEIWRYILQE